MTRETVWCDTPARSATSRIVGCLDMPLRSAPVEIACSWYELHVTAHTSARHGKAAESDQTSTTSSAVLTGGMLPVTVTGNKTEAELFGHHRGDCVAPAACPRPTDA